MLYFFLVVAPQLLTFFFFFNDTATTEIYTLSLHDALPISEVTGIAVGRTRRRSSIFTRSAGRRASTSWRASSPSRSEEHTSELQSQSNLVCRLLLEKKNNRNKYIVLIERLTCTSPPLRAMP